MNKTRKSFMVAGAIISFVLAGILIISSLCIIGIYGSITADMLREILALDPTLTNMAEEEIIALVGIVKVIAIMMGIYILALSIATIPVGVRVIKNTANNNKGAIIALLVLSIFTANILTFAFMIVALCLKNKPVVETVEAK